VNAIYRDASLEEKLAYARTLASAGSLIREQLWAQEPDGKGGTVWQPSAGKILLVMETGDMLGIHPAAALSNINIIDGKPALPPALVAGLVRDAGHELRVVTSGTVEGGDFAALATLVRTDDTAFTYVAEWSLKRAAASGLVQYFERNGIWVLEAVSDSDFSESWVKYPQALAKARALGEVTDEGAQDVKMGLRTPEEMGAKVSENGEMLATPPPREQAAEPAEDWLALAAAATTVQEVVDLGKRAGSDYKGPVRSALMKRHGELTRELEAAAAEAVKPTESKLERFLSGTVPPGDE
jgi:hypothetical protein